MNTKMMLALAGAAIATFGLARVAADAQAKESNPSHETAPAGPSVARGRYLARIAGCNDCHTPGYAPSGGKVAEKDWLIGDALGWKGDWGTTYPSNLRLVLATMSENQWVDYARKLEARPPMPWFVLGFVAMVGVNSVITIPPDVKSIIVTITTILLAMALAAMRMADRLDGTDHRALFDGWLRMAKEKLTDPRTGLLVSSFTTRAEPLDGPEGSSIWVTAHCLRLLDEAFARDQYERAVETLLKPAVDEAIVAFLEREEAQLFACTEAISRFQLTHFREMIPAEFLPLWERSLEGDDFRMKLCGAGGGGFLLGLCRKDATPEGWGWPWEWVV